MSLQQHRGSFWWCVEHFQLGHGPLTVIARLVCRQYSVWPEQLVGYALAWPAVGNPDNPPIAAGPGLSRKPHVVQARREAWTLARMLMPEITARELGDWFGGFSAASVYAAWRRTGLTPGDRRLLRDLPRAPRVEALEGLGGRSLNHAEWYLLLIYLGRAAKANRAKKR